MPDKFLNTKAGEGGGKGGKDGGGGGEADVSITIVCLQEIHVLVQLSRFCTFYHNLSTPPPFPPSTLVQNM